MPKPKPSSRSKSVVASKTPAKPVAITSLVDPVLKRRWEEASRTITEATHEEAQDFDHRWEAVADVVFSNPPLYLAGGFTTDRDFYQQFMHCDRSTGVRKARVARYASPRDIEAFGDTKIDALLDFLEAKSGGPLPSRLPVALDQVRIPVTGQGLPASLTIAQASRDQIRAATRALTVKHAATTKASPHGQLIQQALAAAGLKKVTLTMHRETVDLRGVPLDALAKLGQALARVKAPPAATPKK